MPASNRKALLVVSASGRALAQSAARGDIPVVVLDLFNDLDVRSGAVASASVAGRNGRIDAAKLLAAMRGLCPEADCEGVVYGSGFEGRIGLLEKLARGRTLFGNKPATVAGLKDPERFFGLLGRVGLPHPPIRRLPPPDPRNWLVKRIGGAGGAHVRRATLRHRPRADRYFQMFQHGRLLSALFLADGRRAHVVGYNEQWTVPARPRSPYCYAGAASGADLPRSVAERLAAVLDELTRETGLVGLNGLDFILDGDLPYVIEINPRPPATLDLYDPDVPGGLLALHLKACQGEIGQFDPALRARAHAIVYATQIVRIPVHPAWPAWCTDIPEPGSVIPPGAPICSVHSAAAGCMQARQQVEIRSARLAQQFMDRAA